MVFEIIGVGEEASAKRNLYEGWLLEELQKNISLRNLELEIQRISFTIRPNRIESVGSRRNREKSVFFAEPQKLGQLESFMESLHGRSVGAKVSVIVSTSQSD